MPFSQGGWSGRKSFECESNGIIFVTHNLHFNKFIWDLTSFAVFIVKYFYEEYMNEDTRFLQKYLWKLKAPLKIRIFMWFLYRKALLTKDNIVKRNWIGWKKCAFCDWEESLSIFSLSATLQN
jgi:hypothetical protein